MTPAHARAPALAQGRHLPIVRNRLPTLRSSLSLQDLAPGRMQCLPGAFCDTPQRCRGFFFTRSEEHTSELQSLMRISYAVFCLKKKNTPHLHHINIFTILL